MFNSGTQDAATLLKGAGFAANQVAGAMKSAFNWTENAGKTVAKTAEKVFNPSKW